MIRLIPLLACLGCSMAAAAVQSPELSGRPNVVLVLIDDAGFTDLGAYGGEARTPHIDRLAGAGVKFSNFHTSPLCAPSRAMLLTGVDNHRTGVATIPEVLPPEQRGRPGYTMHLEPGVETVATRLKAAGYRTYMAGKWHLGHGAGDLPDAHGFDRSIALDASGADNWSQRPYMPYYDEAPWFEDGAPARLPDSFYSSEYLVDRMIEFLEEGADAPFFAYLAFTAVHIPVQAPKEFTEHYAGVYDDGWHASQALRWQRATNLGLVPETAAPPTMHPSMRPWTTLTAEQRALYAKSMAVHAGMLEAMDHQIGRLVAHLEAQGQADDTVFVITSDNGPEPSEPTSAPGFDQWMALQGYSRRLEDLGERGSYVFIGPEWASATATPGALFKFYTTEGGLRVPLIVAGPSIADAAPIRSLAFVTDLAPTILDLAGIGMSAPEGTVPMTGRSLLPVLRGQTDRTHGADASIGVEVSGNAALFRGDFKLVRNLAPFGDGQWHLFDVTSDPGETHDLASEQPELFEDLLRNYENYASEMGVLPVPAGYDVHRQIASNTLGKMLEHYGWVLVLSTLVLVGLGFLLLRRLTRYLRG